MTVHCLFPECYTIICHRYAIYNLSSHEWDVHTLENYCTVYWCAKIYTYIHSIYILLKYIHTLFTSCGRLRSVIQIWNKIVDTELDQVLVNLIPVGFWEKSWLFDYFHWQGGGGFPRKGRPIMNKRRIIDVHVNNFNRNNFSPRVFPHARIWGR